MWTDFSYTRGPRVMVWGSEDGFAPGVRDYGDDFGRLGSDHETIAGPGLGDAPDDPENEGFACQR